MMRENAATREFQRFNRWCIRFGIGAVDVGAGHGKPKRAQIGVVEFPRIVGQRHIAALPNLRDDLAN